MPNMTREDFGSNVPTNADDIIQHVNNLILYHEECVFWSDDHAGTDRWETDLIRRCVSGDRSGDLSAVPLPIY